MEFRPQFAPHQTKSLRTILLELERRWGVKVGIGFSLRTDGPRNSLLVMDVSVYEEVHQAELNGFTGIAFEVYDTASMPLEIQAIAAVMALNDAILQHMSKG